MPDKIDYKDALKFILFFGALSLIVKNTTIWASLFSVFGTVTGVIVVLVLGTLLLTLGFEVIKQFLRFFND